MKRLTGNEIRKMYLDFFESKGHKVMASASLVPQNDPTLLWINAGVAPLKKYFDGREVPENPRMTNAQKSIRTNDIENVGKTARHHTFFEMLGNFSIGDYFRTEAVTWAYELLTSEQYFAIDKNKLYITVYEDDAETYNLWINLGIDPTHIIKTIENNFWEIGEGPCGPCTEIFYDRGETYDPEGLGIKLLAEDLENDRYIEIWNNVFSQYNSKDGLERSQYPELPSKNIDTGMGLERMACISQNVETNFDTDLFLPIIRKTEELSGVEYNASTKMAFRVIADHIRTITFAVSDGALLSNEGRGYVLRRILRRAVRFGKKLGIEKPFMYLLVPVVIEIMDDYYPYLKEKMNFVQKVVKSEEERFHATLEAGEKKLKEMIEHTDSKVLNGKDAFTLYDTYGFPFELTLEICEESGFTVDKAAFESEMNQQRERARAARGEMEGMHSQNEALLNFKEHSEFVGYNKLETTAKVIAIVKDGQFVDELDGFGEVFLSETPFYAESGGQVADKGVIFNENVKATVLDVQKAPNKQHSHRIEVLEGTLVKGDTITATVDIQTRNAIKKNHTATHLLHKAIKEVLGDHANQAGAYKDSQRLRLDFTHTDAITSTELKEIERLVNEQIWLSQDVHVSEMKIDEARKMGAMALFGEKYGDIVRVVNVPNYSIELCGGTHVTNTSEIGLFKVISEGGIGAGTRRIEATTSKNAYQLTLNTESTIEDIASKIKSSKVNVIEKLDSILVNFKELEKTNENLNQKLANYQASSLSENIIENNNIKVLVSKLNGIDNNSLRTMIDGLKDKHENIVILLASIVDGRVVFAAGVSKTLISKFNAGQLVRQAAEMCDGKGGGRPDFAQAGAKDVSKVDEALKVILESIKNNN